MKKFLRINLPRSEKEVPLVLDAQILASAAIHARSIRRKRLALKMAFPAVAAAAAVAIVAVGTYNTLELSKRPAVTAMPIAQSTAIITKQEVLPPAPQVVENSAELLALADMTVLEQESYNLAAMADFSFDGDSITI